MKKTLLVLLMALCLLVSAACAQAPAAPEITAIPEAPATATDEPEPMLDKDLVILYTNDVHCGVDVNIGYAGLAAYKKQMESDGNYVALVDCGDYLQGEAIGTLSKGEYLIDMMNELGYDAATIGNHEFDYGAERFLELAKKSQFPIVSCNFRDLAANTPLFDAYVMKEYNGVKVAFVGISTPKTITSSAPVYFQNDAGEFIYSFDQDTDGKLLYATVQAAVDDARAAGAKYVVALAHLGITADASPWTSSEVITNTSGIDVVLDGHSHSVVGCERVKNKDGEWTLLSQTGTKLNAIGMLLIQKNGSISTGLVTDYTEKDADMDAYVKSIQAEFEQVLGEVVAKTDVDLTIKDPENPDVRIIRIRETNLGDLCADAYRIMGNADIAFVNGGGIRATIPTGDITYGQIISVHPYGNALCVIEASGQEILDALEMGARALPEENGGFLQVSGLTYEIDTSVASTVKLTEDGLFESVEGDRRVSNVKVGDADIDPAKTYTLASHNYMLFDQGDGYTMFKDNVVLQDSIMLDNQVLINYITQTLGGVVGADYAEPYGQGRIVVK